MLLCPEHLLILTGSCFGGMRDTSTSSSRNSKHSVEVSRIKAAGWDGIPPAGCACTVWIAVSVGWASGPAATATTWVNVLKVGPAVNRRQSNICRRLAQVQLAATKHNDQSVPPKDIAPTHSSAMALWWEHAWVTWLARKPNSDCLTCLV